MQRKLLLITGLLLIVLGIGMMVFQSSPVAMAQDEEPYDPTSLPEIEAAWMGSGHADFEAEAFVHWDEDGEVEQNCARCHSEGGYLDYMGEDGSDFFSVDAPAALGTVVSCVVCHNSTASTLDFVEFPSGEEIDIDGDSARCMVCHQGRASQATVDAAIDGMEDMNAVSEDLRFINIHYYAAAASLYGSVVNGGYEIEGNFYQPQFEHVEGYQECDDCHNPHTLELRIDECAECHDADDVEEVQEIRMVGSLADYDGDGDIEEGIYAEIQGLQEVLYVTMQEYSAEVTGARIGRGGGYPYFFIDTDGDGVISEEEGVRDNAFSTFTPNLLIAVYNYQFSLKDPGNYAHNAKYHIELLYDSTMLLAEAMGMTMDDMVAQINRDDRGHFDATLEAFRHWDEDGEVSASCSRCHTSEGLPFELENGANIAFEPSNSLECTTCHTDLEDFDLYEQEFVTFPSGAELAFESEAPSNLCLNCHQGRNSGVNIQAAIDGAGVGDDEVSERLRFQNPHYFAGGASLFGADANGAYQYPDMEYAGQNMHAEDVSTCVDCHSAHTGEVQIEECAECHEADGELDPTSIRFVDEGMEAVDYDGDGDATEGIAGELATLEEMLLAEIIAYGADVIGTPIGQGGGYPYWFVDTNGDGMIDGEEGVRDNSYPSWTPTLLKSIYNWQWVHSDPGGYAHNGEYLIQVMYDTLMDIGGEEAVAGMTRP